MSKTVSFFYRKPSLLSLDVAAGAVISSAFFARHLRVTPVPWLQLAVLGGAVWCIYTADHLLDARRIKTSRVAERYRFHQQHWWVLFGFLVATAALTAVAALLFLPGIVLVFGAALAGFMLVYFLLHHFLPRRYFFKEFWVSVLYPSGIWGGMAIRSGAITAADWLLLAFFSAICLQNVLLLAWYETDEDVSQAQISITQIAGKEWARKLVLLVGGLGFCAVGVGFGFLRHTVFCTADRQTEPVFWAIFLMMTAILSLMAAFPTFFRIRYRWLADGVFLLPGFIWFV